MNCHVSCFLSKLLLRHLQASQLGLLQQLEKLVVLVQGRLGLLGTVLHVGVVQHDVVALKLSLVA